MKNLEYEMTNFMYFLSFILNISIASYLIYSNNKLYIKLEDLYRKLNYRHHYINYTESIPEIQIISNDDDVIISNENQKKDYIVL